MPSFFLTAIACRERKSTSIADAAWDTRKIYDQLGREHGHAGRHSNDDDHLPPGQSKDKHGKGKGHDDQ